jgi:hypothetical protein
MSRKRRIRILILALGILTIGILVILPVILPPLHSWGHPSETEILAALFGPQAKLQESPDGNTIFVVEQLSEGEKEQFHYASQVHTEIVYQQKGWGQNPDVLLVFTKTGPPDCCSQTRLSVLGGAILRAKNETLEVVAERKLLLPLSNFEGLSRGDFVNIGPGKTGFRWQDSAILNTGLQTRDLIIAMIDGELKVVASLETLANNSHQCSPQPPDEPCWETKATYEFLAGDQLDYYEILITTNGTKWVNGNMISIGETQKLIFVDGQYRSENP